MKPVSKKTVIIFVFVIAIILPAFSAETEQESVLPPDSRVKKKIESVLAIGFEAETEQESVLSPDSRVKKKIESVLAIGFERGNFWRSSFDTGDGKTHRSSPAVNLYYYLIGEEKSVGFFAHNFIGFPNWSGMYPGYTDYFGVQSGLLIGPLFKHAFSQKFALLYGVGFNFLITFESYEPLTAAEKSFIRQTYDFGLGVDLMLRYAISNHLLLCAGCILTGDILSFVILDTSPSNPSPGVSVSKDFPIFGVRPYVSIGFRF